MKYVVTSIQTLKETLTCNYCSKEVNSLPVQLLSHFRMESYPEGDQVGHETLLLILRNHHFFLNNTENSCGHSGSKTA